MKTPKEKKDSASVFVGDILRTYKAAMRVEGEALKAAMECGKYLNLAQENVKADNGGKKGKWLPWLKQNCPEISQQTASLYMRLADPENLDKLVGVKTIRDADAALRKPRDEDGGGDGDSDDAGDDDDNADDETNNALLKSKRGPPDLKDLMENCGADEIIDNLEDDADKLEEVAAASIVKLTPEKVYEVLRETWTTDQLRDLRSRLNTYLSSLSSTPQDTPDAPARRSSLPTPEFGRRM
jgi:hypothetical protein